MAGEFTQAYNQTSQVIDAIFGSKHDRERKRQEKQQRRAQREAEKRAAEQQAAQREAQERTAQQQAAQREAQERTAQQQAAQREAQERTAQQAKQREEMSNGAPQPLSEYPPALPEDAYTHGYHYHPTGEKNTYQVTHYPTGRTLGEIRETEDGSWETRHREDSTWEPAAFGEDPEGNPNFRHAAAEELELRHLSETEVWLQQEGLTITPGAHDLETIHDAQNALQHGISRGQVGRYLAYDADPAATPTPESTADAHAVEEVAGSSWWNTASDESRQRVLTDSVWANLWRTEESSFHHGYAQHQQLSQQIAPSPSTTQPGAPTR